MTKNASSFNETPKFSFDIKKKTDPTVKNEIPAVKKKNMHKKNRGPKKIYPIFPYKFLAHLKIRSVKRVLKTSGGWKFKWMKQKVYYWKKRKVYKQNRHIHNFFFMMCRKRYFSPAKYNARFMGYQKYLKKTHFETRYFINTRVKHPFKIRWSKKRKRYFKLALAFKHIFKRYYRLTEKQFKKLREYLKKKTNKLSFLIWFFEGRIATISVRFHFFWTVKRAARWILTGIICINNISITREQTVVKINDFVTLLGPVQFFAFRFMKLNGAAYFHTKFYKTINYQMYLPKVCSVIILRLPSRYSELKTILRKRTKRWIKFSTFLYLANSFY